MCSEMSFKCSFSEYNTTTQVSQNSTNTNYCISAWFVIIFSFLLEWLDVTNGQSTLKDCKPVVHQSNHSYHINLYQQNVSWGLELLTIGWLWPLVLLCNEFDTSKPSKFLFHQGSTVSQYLVTWVMITLGKKFNVTNPASSSIRQETNCTLKGSGYQRCHGCASFVIWPELHSSLEVAWRLNEHFKTVYQTCKSWVMFLECLRDMSADAISVWPWDIELKSDVRAVHPLLKTKRVPLGTQTWSDRHSK